MMSDGIRLLDAIDQGDPLAAGQLLPLVYEELRRCAAAQLALEKPGQTRDATALVHEAFLRLVGKERFADRRHFFRVAEEAPAEQLLELNEALDRFAAVDPVKAELAKLRYFAGLSDAEAAATLGISRASASRYWTYARAWLIDALDENPG